MKNTPFAHDHELLQLIEACEANPSDTGSTVVLCYQLNLRSYHSDCLAYAEKGLALDPTNGDLYYERIIAGSLDHGVLEDIMEQLEHLSEDQPEDLSVKINLALAHFYLEHNQMVDTLLDDIFLRLGSQRAHPKAYEIKAQLELSRMELDTCIKSCERAEADPDCSARTIRLKGLAHLELGDLDRAEACFRDALQKEPNFVWACHSLASLSFEKGQYEQAFRFLGKAAFINPRYPGNFFLPAEAYMDLESYDLALAELQKLRMLDLGDRIEAEALNGIGYLYMKKEDLTKAQMYLSEAIDLQPHLAEAYYNMGILAVQKGDSTMAIHHLKAALERDPGNVESLVELGYIYLEKEDFDASKQYFLQALDIDDTEEQAHVGLARVYLDSEQFERMLNHAKRAFEINPDSGSVCNILGIGYEVNGDLIEAEIAYLRALESNPFHAQAANNLGYLYEKLMESEPDNRDRWKDKAIEAWCVRWQICNGLGRSTKGATTHLIELGWSRKDIRSLAELPYPDEDELG